MNKHQEQVSDFMRAFGQNVPERYTPGLFPGQLRARLIAEEAEEFGKAVQAGNFAEIVDAICDLLYVTYGAASALGIDIDPFFDEVHRSNMSKLDARTGRPIYRDDGKVLKPETWSPPNINGMLRQVASPRFADASLDAVP